MIYCVLLAFTGLCCLDPLGAETRGESGKFQIFPELNSSGHQLFFLSIHKLLKYVQQSLADFLM